MLAASMAAAPQRAAAAAATGLARALSRATGESSTVARGHRLIDKLSKDLVDDIFANALKKQTGVSLKCARVTMAPMRGISAPA